MEDRTNAERQARFKERKREETEARLRAEAVTREMLARFPSSDRNTEAGRADRAAAHAAWLRDRQ